MKHSMSIICRFLILLFLTSFFPERIYGQSNSLSNLDEQVKKFLEDNKGEWSDLNVPYEDGKILFDLILKNNYTSALEIGTSTGHSTIWMAWALSKTGGKLTTIEIDNDRQKVAIKNLKEAGLSEFVDFKLGDAHQLVKAMKGPFDFVFSDADKGWYLQYFKDLDPKLKLGGCFTAHNVLEGYSGTGEFLEYVKKKANYETTIDKSSSAGISISYKKKN
jgi:caffeoyl-CoA O-methyltransferase